MYALLQQSGRFAATVCDKMPLSAAAQPNGFVVLTAFWDLSSRSCRQAATVVSSAVAANDDLGTALVLAVSLSDVACASRLQTFPNVAAPGPRSMHIHDGCQNAACNL